jgi:hypothetical protein
MTDEAQQDPMLQKKVTLIYSIGAINDIINMMNNPITVPVMVWATLINNIQGQLAPQIEKLNMEAQTDEQAAG